MQWEPANAADFLDPELVVLHASQPCPLCGTAVGEHDAAACEAKMAAWRPRGILNALAGLQSAGDPPLDQ